MQKNSPKVLTKRNHDPFHRPAYRDRCSNLDPAVLGQVTNKLDDLLEEKNKAIQDLQFEIARVMKAHNDLLRTYEAKLAEYGIPKQELGFQPLRTDTSTGPAGLVAAPS